MFADTPPTTPTSGALDLEARYPSADAIGAALVRRAIDRVNGRPEVDLGAYRAWSRGLMVNPTPLTPRGALAVVIEHLRTFGAHTPQSLDRLACDMSLFIARMDLLGVDDLRSVERSHVTGYLEEAVPSGDGFADPSVATQHVRRAAVRLLFRVARGLDICDHDPTLDIRLPPRTAHRTRPLSDEEILMGELASEHSLTATRLPAAWALAEAGASTSELAAATVGDVDLVAARVRLHGSGRRHPRTNALTAWGVTALRSRLDELGDDPTTPIVYRSQLSPKSGQSASCDAVHDVLRRAGLTVETDVRPASVAGWAGRRAFERRQRIEDAALVLGLRSLDAAAQAIAWDWRHHDLQ